jgi:hypothetical protein
LAGIDGKFEQNSEIGERPWDFGLSIGIEYCPLIGGQK